MQANGPKKPTEKVGAFNVFGISEVPDLITLRHPTRVLNWEGELQDQVLHEAELRFAVRFKQVQPVRNDEANTPPKTEITAIKVRLACMCIRLQTERHLHLSGKG